MAQIRTIIRRVPVLTSDGVTDGQCRMQAEPSSQCRSGRNEEKPSFNQAEILLRSSESGDSGDAGNAGEIREPAAKGSLGGRAANLSGAFAAGEGDQGVITDDIYTTRSTIRRARRATAGIGNQPSLFRRDLHDRKKMRRKK